MPGVVSGRTAFGWPLIDQAAPTLDFRVLAALFTEDRGVRREIE